MSESGVKMLRMACKRNKYNYNQIQMKYYEGEWLHVESQRGNVRALPKQFCQASY